MPKRKKATKLCYVIMPFSKTRACTEEEWTEIFEALIKPAVEEAGLGYRCLRSEATTGNIIRKVVNSLYQANVVIADLTDRNPNVFYELGVRHTLKSRTIMIAQRRKDIPSDLDGYASHVYKWKTTAQKGELTKKLRRLLEHIEENPDRSDNPVSDFIRDTTIRLFEFQREADIRKLRALKVELDGLKRELQRFADGKVRQVRPLLMAYPALDHLAATQYIANDAFCLHALGLRLVLEVARDAPMSAVAAQKLLPPVSAMVTNADRMLAAYTAGDDLGSLNLEDIMR